MVDCKPMLIDRPRHWLRQRVPLCASDFQLDLEGDIGTCSFARLLGHCLVRLARENPIKTLFPSTPLASRDYLDYWSRPRSRSSCFNFFRILIGTLGSKRFLGGRNLYSDWNVKDFGKKKLEYFLNIHKYSFIILMHDLINTLRMLNKKYKILIR